MDSAHQNKWESAEVVDENALGQRHLILLEKSVPAPHTARTPPSPPRTSAVELAKLPFEVSPVHEIHSDPPIIARFDGELSLAGEISAGNVIVAAVEGAPRQFDGKWQAVETSADVRHRCGGVGVERKGIAYGAGGEELYAAVGGSRLNRKLRCGCTSIQAQDDILVLTVETQSGCWAMSPRRCT